jgi:hypothetical protein
MSAGTGTSAHSIRSLAEWTLASEPPDVRLTLEAHALSLAVIRCATPKGVRWGSLSSAKNIASSLIACAGVEGSRQ